MKQYRNKDTEITRYSYYEVRLENRLYRYDTRREADVAVMSNMYYGFSEIVKVIYYYLNGEYLRVLRLIKLHQYHSEK